MKKINDYSELLVQKIKNINVEELPVSNYFKLYFDSYARNIDSIIYKYENILTEATHNKTKDIVFLDYGGGTGILSFLAKISGINKVYYLDISEEMVNGVKKLSQYLEIPIDGFFKASYENMTAIDGIMFDVIANYDVLEHLYIPLKAFEVLLNYLNPDGVIYMASGANTFHPIIQWFTKKKHYQSEFIGTQIGKEIDSKEAFFNIRINYIKKEFPNLKEELVKHYAKLTRGLRQDDISNKIKSHINKQKLITPPPYLNTCDPVTGNWDEHLINYFEFAKQLKRIYKKAEVLHGWYSPQRIKYEKNIEYKDDNYLKKIYSVLHYLSIYFAPIENCILKILPYPICVMLAPYYVVKVQVENKTEHNKEIANIYNNWATWQDKPSNINTTLHYVPNKSLSYLYEFMHNNNINTNSTILDAGCGNGVIALNLIKNKYNVYSCDISENASRYLPNFKLSSIDKLDYENETFNLVYSFSVIHHLSDPCKAINEIKRILKPNGFFITTQHTKNSIFTLQRKMKLFLFPSQNKHLKYITFKNAQDWIDIIENNGFELIDKKGINHSFILTKIADILQYIYNKFKIDFFNPFAWLDEQLGQILPSSVRSEMAYHSYLIFRKK